VLQQFMLKIVAAVIMLLEQHNHQAGLIVIPVLIITHIGLVVLLVKEGKAQDVRLQVHLILLLLEEEVVVVVFMVVQEAMVVGILPVVELVVQVVQVMETVHL